MATAIKHKKRSSRKNRTNIIPVGMFASRAHDKARARFFMNLMKSKSSEEIEEE